MVRVDTGICAECLNNNTIYLLDPHKICISCLPQFCKDLLEDRMDEVNDLNDDIKRLELEVNTLEEEVESADDDNLVLQNHIAELEEKLKNANMSS